MRALFSQVKRKTRRTMKMKKKIGEAKKTPNSFLASSTKIMTVWLKNRSYGASLKPCRIMRWISNKWSTMSSKWTLTVTLIFRLMVCVIFNWLYWWHVLVFHRLIEVCVALSLADLWHALNFIGWLMVHVVFIIGWFTKKFIA